MRESIENKTHTKVKDIGQGLQSHIALITTDFSLVQGSLYLTECEITIYI